MINTNVLFNLTANEKEEQESTAATLERLLLVGLHDKKSVEVQEAAAAALTEYFMTRGNGGDNGGECVFAGPLIID